MRSQRGFSLVEVMIALAILGLGLTVLIRSIAASAAQGPEAQMMGVTTNLARGKMLDVEEVLLKDGFLDTEQSSEGDFDAEGWPDVAWSAKVEIVELPSLDTIQQLQEQAVADAEAAARGQGSAAGSGSGASGGFGDSALGGMLSMLGGMGGGDTEAMTSGAAAIYPILQDVFKASLRKVTLTVSYKIGGRERSFDTVAFFTDPAGMTKAIGSAGAAATEAGGGTGGTGTSGTGGTGTSGGGSGRTGGTGGGRLTGGGK